MPSSKAYLWHYAPFIRLLLPLIMGIIIQWYFPLAISFLVITACSLVFVIIIYFFLTDKRKYQLTNFNGLVIHLLLFITGACLVWLNDIRNEEKWVGKMPSHQYLVVRILEPLVEKQNSYKAQAEVVANITEGKQRETKGKLIIYFKKDSLLEEITYGSQIIFKKPLQEIKNSGNPGSFNYRQYCMHQGISHQVYLTETDFLLLRTKKKNVLQQFLFQTRQTVVNTIKKYIPGEKEQGLAEALLIGYKDDLDKNLVQAYSNTGVVHIIAISGLHLGLIYWLLLVLTKPIKRKKTLSWLRFLIIISSLWTFSLLAGAGPSVLRSAVMFSCIAFGEVLNKKSSIYNTLALSAFILLCINPFWLWDVGFQLSYSAVLSIVIFFRPIYNWLFIENKLLDWLWKLNAVTLAAQILTLPISVYHFHQFPTLFLFANLLAVPLSSFIVIGEIILVVISFIHPLAKATGWALSEMIKLMNFYVERLDHVPFAVWNNLSLSITQTVFLLAFIAFTGYWLIEKKPKAIWPALICLLSFVSLRTLSFIEAYQQKELIVYNVPKHRAIDLIDGRNYLFVGDKELEQDDFIRNFHLQPSRVLHRIKPATSNIQNPNSFEFSGKRVVIVDNENHESPMEEKKRADVIILSQNPRLYINKLNDVFDIQQLVIDGSVPVWKAKLWKKDCDSLGIACHDVSDKGAFVMKVQ